MGFVQQQLEKRIPARARASMWGVRLIFEPYAEMACAAWSSVMMKSTLRRASRAAPMSPRGSSPASAAPPTARMKSFLPMLMRLLLLRGGRFQACSREAS